MEKVNYIIQFNAVLEYFNNDDRIKQGHITLYLAFFQKWNRKFFSKLITVNRQFIMEKAKIKSKTTYHSCVRDLHNWNYLTYYPSYSPSRGSKIKMTVYRPNFDTSSGTSSDTSSVQKLASSVPEPSQNMVPSYKHKTKENLNKLAKPKNEFEVLIFFKENNWPAIEGKKYYAYYNTKDWKLSRGLAIKNWKETAKNYIENGHKMKEEYTSPISDYVNYLRKYDNRNKDYGQPL